MANEIVGLLGSIYMSTGTSTSFTTEAMTDSGDHMRYSITNTAKKYFDNLTDVLVYVDGDLVTTGYTIEHITGSVIFEASQGADPITVSGKYFSVAEVGAFFNWKLSINKSILDTTAFGSEWNTNITALKSWTVTAEKYYINDDMTDILLAGNNIVLILYVNESTPISYQGYAFMSKDDVNTTVAEIIKESLEFTGNSTLVFLD